MKETRAQKIDFMIIGAQKAGSSSLRRYLSAHPDIVTHIPKEFDFFCDNSAYQKNTYENVFAKYFHKMPKEHRVKILAKSAALYTDESFIRRLANHNPDCKIIFSLRDPVQRAYSSYKMEHFGGWVKSDFDEIISGDLAKMMIDGKTHLLKGIEKSYFRIFIELGIYSIHIKNILKYFSKDQVKFILFEDFIDNPETQINVLFEWLGVDAKPSNEFIFSRVHNKSHRPNYTFLSSLLTYIKSESNPLKKISKLVLPYKTFLTAAGYIEGLNKSNDFYPELCQETKDILRKFYSSYNEELLELTDLNFDRWNT